MNEDLRRNLKILRGMELEEKVEIDWSIFSCFTLWVVFMALLCFVFPTMLFFRFFEDFSFWTGVGYGVVMLSQFLVYFILVWMAVDDMSEYMFVYYQIFVKREGE